MQSQNSAAQMLSDTNQRQSTGQRLTNTTQNFKWQTSRMRTTLTIELPQWYRDPIPSLMHSLPPLELGLYWHTPSLNNCNRLVPPTPFLPLMEIPTTLSTIVMLWMSLLTLTQTMRGRSWTETRVMTRAAKISQIEIKEPTLGTISIVS